MRKTHLLAVTAAGLLLWGGPVFSQAPVNRPPGNPSTVPVAAPASAASMGPRLALIDVSRIFKKHYRFQALIDQMKQDASQAEARVRERNNAIQKEIEELQSYKVGSAKYKELEEVIANKRAKLSIDVNMQRKEFMQREAKIYHDVYLEIEKVLDYYCQNQSIDMVLRFSGEPVDVNNPESIGIWINRPVVWYNRGLDITDYILSILNRGNPAPANNTIGRPPAGPNSIPFK
ncbi:MAG: OmpH family outer membrane protein [Pirellulales bacterium]|nr:OmpH family outer membrane protein [Pirellulales bacterium]